MCAIKTQQNRDNKKGAKHPQKTFRTIIFIEPEYQADYSNIRNNKRQKLAMHWSYYP